MPITFFFKDIALSGVSELFYIFVKVWIKWEPLGAHRNFLCTGYLHWEGIPSSSCLVV